MCRVRIVRQHICNHSPTGVAPSSDHIHKPMRTARDHISPQKRFAFGKNLNGPRSRDQFDGPHSQLELPFSFLARNPHRDRDIDVPHSQLELPFSFLACNPHRDRGIGVPHSQLKLVVSCKKCNTAMLFLFSRDQAAGQKIFKKPRLEISTKFLL